MTTNDTIKRLEQLFIEEIDKKTGWGKIEVKTIFHACVRVAMGEYIDDKENGDKVAKIMGYKGDYNVRGSE